MPIPAGPSTVTRCGTRSLDTRSQTPRSMSSSGLRPTSSPESLRVPAGTEGSIAIQASTGLDLPFASTGSAGS